MSVAEQCNHPDQDFYDDLLTQEAQTTDPNYKEIIKVLTPGAVKLLTEAEPLLSERPIILEELSAALKKSRDNMATGSTKFKGSYYKVFWYVLKLLVIKIVQQIQNKNTLPPSQQFVIVAIIHESDKDLLLIKNWRPLTLLNTRYKLISSLLASTLKLILTKILCSHQKAYIPNIFINKVTCNTFNLFHYAK